MFYKLLFIFFDFIYKTPLFLSFLLVYKPCSYQFDKGA